MGHLRLVGEAAPRSWFEALRDWDQWLVARALSDATRRTYRFGMVSLIVETCIDPLELSEQQLTAYVAGLDPRGQKREVVLKGARSFYGWAQRRGLVVANPVAELTVRRRQPGAAPYLTDEELRRVLSAAFRRDRRRGWALMLAWATGGREGSLAAVEPADIDLARGWIHFRVAKWDRPYGVPLGRAGRAACRWLIADADRAARGTLLGIRPRTMWTWAREAGRTAGVPCWPHLLRHTFATRLAADPTVDQRTWIELMNHRDGSQFRRYAAARPDRLAAAMERF